MRNLPLIIFGPWAIVGAVTALTVGLPYGVSPLAVVAGFMTLLMMVSASFYKPRLPTGCFLALGGMLLSMALFTFGSWGAGDVTSNRDAEHTEQVVIPARGEMARHGKMKEIPAKVVYVNPQVQRTRKSANMAGVLVMVLAGVGGLVAMIRLRRQTTPQQGAESKTRTASSHAGR